MKLPPGAADFYLDLINRGDTRLSGLPLEQGLRVSALAEQTGKGAFLLDYVTRYGTDSAAMKALLDKSPAAINAIKYVYDARTGQYRDLSTRPLAKVSVGGAQGCRWQQSS